MSSFDYTAFGEKNVSQYNGKLPGLPKLTPIKYLYLFISAGLILIFLPALLLLPVFIAVAISALVTLFFYFRLQDGSENSIKTALFANRNNLTYVYRGEAITESIAGSILEANLTSNRIYGVIGTSNYVIGSSYNNKSSQTVMILDLENTYPHILLDSRNNKQTSKLKNIHSYTKINLEGNFPDYFTVYTSTNPIETLQILSPELMARLIDYSTRADIEIIGTKLILFCKYKDFTKDIFEMLYFAAEQILKDVGSNSNNSKVRFDTTKSHK